MKTTSQNNYVIIVSNSDAFKIAQNLITFLFKKLPETETRSNYFSLKQNIDPGTKRLRNNSWTIEFKKISRSDKEIKSCLKQFIEENNISKNVIKLK